MRYYLLTELLDEGKDGFILTVCNGGQVWRETGRGKKTQMSFHREDEKLVAVRLMFSVINLLRT